MKKFKSKKHVKIKYIRILITILILISLITLFKKIPNIKILNLTPIKILESSNNYTQEKKDYIKKTITQLTKVDINKPTTILKQTMIYEKAKESEKKYYSINNKIEKHSPQPLVYIYNTHQTEEYIGNTITPTPTVLTAANYLKDKLEENEIKTIVEEESIPDILKNNNWNYTQSYKASRINLEKIKEQYPDIKIFIDLHRDSVNKKLSTVTINDKEYAKVLFVIGKEHENYQKNLDFTQSINNIIEKNYPTLTKGILQKEGPGVNGIYNQDLGTNIILMEVGAHENTMEEVANTLDLISEIIKEKIYEE